MGGKGSAVGSVDPLGVLVIWIIVQQRRIILGIGAGGFLGTFFLSRIIPLFGLLDRLI